MAEINQNQIQNAFERLFHAKNELLICSPFISPNYLTDLIDIAKKNVKVKVITSQGNKNFYSSTLWILNKFQKTPNFESKIIERLHAKIYISDNKFAIHGSANLTFGGLKTNIEQISILEEKNEVRELKKIFGYIWKDDTAKFESKPKSQGPTLKISLKEQAITDAKKFLLKNSQKYPTKELLFIVRERLRAYYHLGDLRLEHYLKIALSDLKVKHGLNLNENLLKTKFQPKYSFAEIRKKYPMAYEPWTKQADQALKKFWNDKSNHKSGNEKIRELMKKCGRNSGSIVSRLKKLGLE